MPFAYLALSVLMGNPYFDIIHGIVVGHIYYFLVDVVPLVYGKDVLHTPQFFIDFFGIGEYVPPAPAAPARAGGQPLGGHGNNTWNGPGRVNAPNDPARGNRGGHQWGSGGRALGAD
jgi:Derlin-2/3